MIKSMKSQLVRFAKADIIISANSDNYTALLPNPKLRALEKKYKKNRKWTDVNFAYDYVPEYIHQLQTKACRDELNELYKKSKEGKTIVIANHSNGSDNAWSTILVGMLAGAGAECEDTNPKTFYYNTFKTLKMT